MEDPILPILVGLPYPTAILKDTPNKLTSDYTKSLYTAHNYALFTNLLYACDMLDSLPVNCQMQIY